MIITLSRPPHIIELTNLCPFLTVQTTGCQSFKVKIQKGQAKLNHLGMFAGIPWVSDCLILLVDLGFASRDLLMPSGKLINILNGQWDVGGLKF